MTQPPPALPEFLKEAPLELSLTQLSGGLIHETSTLNPISWIFGGNHKVVLNSMIKNHLMKPKIDWFLFKHPFIPLDPNLPNGQKEEGFPRA